MSFSLYPTDIVQGIKREGLQLGFAHEDIVDVPSLVV